MNLDVAFDELRVTTALRRIGDECRENFLRLEPCEELRFDEGVRIRLHDVGRVVLDLAAHV